MLLVAANLLILFFPTLVLFVLGCDCVRHYYGPHQRKKLTHISEENKAISDRKLYIINTILIFLYEFSTLQDCKLSDKNKLLFI